MPIESARFSSDPPLRERARAYVVDTFTAIDGKPPSDEAVERATELVCRAFAHLEEPGDGAFGDPLRLDPLWESRLRVMAAERGKKPRALLVDLIRERWNSANRG